MDAISDMEYDYIASVHYAKVVHPPAGPSVLELSQDMVKGQTYFLSHLSQSQLKQKFPLITKCGAETFEAILKFCYGLLLESKLTQKNKKLYQKRARDYNSDDEEEDESKKPPEVTIHEKIFTDANMGPNYDEVEEEEEDSDKDENSDGEDHGEIQSGITRFGDDDGCNAFKMAFKSIMKSKGDDALGPVLSAHNHLIAQKLAGEEAEKKAKGQARKAKHLVAEKGHVKPFRVT
ncbi:hypothetical protein Bca4012_027854 [Brassica carinata]